MVLTQLSFLLIHIRLVAIVIGCLIRVTKKLRVNIYDIALLVPSNQLKGNSPIGQLVSHTSKKATKANRRKEFSCSCRDRCRAKHMVLTQLSSLLIHIRLVAIVIGCLIRVTKKLRVNIDDITLLVPSKECSM